MLLGTAIAAFVADLRLAGRSPRTIEGHELEIARLGRWLEEQHLCWRSLSRPELMSYARLRAGLGHSSRANMMCSLRTFYRWAVEEGHVAMSPAAALKTPRRPKPLPRSLTRDQVRRLVEWLASSTSRRDRRDRALVLTGLYSGLRASELARLRWSDIDVAGQALGVYLSKGNKGRAVPLHQQLVDELETWRDDQAGAKGWPVFSLDGQAITPARVGKVCRHVSDACGVRFTAHMLRHTFATWMLRGSGDLYAVSKALGHSQVQQTEIYLSADIDQVRAALARLPDSESW